MQTNFNFPEVTSSALEFLEKKLNYKYVTLRHYRSRWLFIKEYMESHNLDSLNPAVCRDYLLSFYDGRKRRDLSVNEKLIEKSIAVLSEFMETGAIQKRSKIIYLDGPIGILMKDFLSFKESRRISRLTLDKVESHMSKFNFWLSANDIFNISEIKETNIIGFIRSLDPGKKALIHDTLMDLRGFTFAWISTPCGNVPWMFQVSIRVFTLKEGEYFFMSNRAFWSIYAPYLREFIAFKRSLGYKFDEQERILCTFDSFLLEQLDTSIGLTKEITDKWSERRNNVSDLTRYMKILLI
jgi:hypothetical protein